MTRVVIMKRKGKYVLGTFTIYYELAVERQSVCFSINSKLIVNGREGSCRVQCAPVPCAVQPDVELRSAIIDFDASSRFPRKIERLAVFLKYTIRVSYGACANQIYLVQPTTYCQMDAAQLDGICSLVSSLLFG